MKWILEFDMPDDREEFDMNRKAGDYMSACHDIDQYCRNQLKHHTTIRRKWQST